ncbi:MAG TPA: cytochrome D1 domain-containing protein [Pyrinomonadaceae bacterium]|nr:cytochrome D1 domain-containing protein [Pyrinomonadaceae bacterium]
MRLTLLFACALAACAPAAYARQAGGEQPRPPQRLTREGVTVEFTAEPAAGGKGVGLLEGSEATVRFRVTDESGGKPLGKLRPASWIQLRRGEKAPDAKECREKVQSYLQASYGDRPEIDLNSYFILALNEEPNISVIDPLSGFGGTKLYTLVALLSPGEDWLLSGDKKRLYVSMPLVNQVAVVDTATWKVIANVAAGARPVRLALMHDEKYLWAGDDDAEEGETGTVTLIDTATLRVAAQIETGAGHHEIAFTDDDAYGFVTNRDDGTLSVIDVGRLAKVKDLRVGTLPSALAFSPLAKAVYVASEGDGIITAVAGKGHEVVARMKAQPGLRALRFLPGGRFGFAVNRATDTVNVFDASTNTPTQAVRVGPSPDQIAFTKDFAYVRSTGSEYVTLIKIRGLGEEGSDFALTRFPAGQRPPQASPHTSAAASVITAPEAGSVLVANAADKTIYFYAEGMAAPMGSFQNYSRDPRAVLVLDNSLGETSPGVYTTTVKLERQGHYDVAFLLDSPRMVGCFDIAVKENPDLPKPKGVPIRVETLSDAAALRVGEGYRLRFKVTDAGTNQPKTDLKDMGVLVFLAPGIWQQREWAAHAGGGVYEMSFTPPQAGVYYIYFRAPSLGVQFNQMPFLTLRATSAEAAPRPKAAQQ